MERKHSLIRTIYLYLFTILGLALLTIGSVGFLNMALKAFVFTEAEEGERIYELRPPEPALSVLAPSKGSVSGTAVKEGAEKLAEGEPLSDEERAEVRRWLLDYKAWSDRNERFDPVASRRHRDASQNLAFIFVGLPLYLYHWGVIKREIRERNSS